jgi:hypothetical protein
VPAELELARTVEATVSMSRLWVYATGFVFDLVVELDDEWSELDPFDFGRWRGKASGEPSPERLRLGFELADGSRITGEGWAGPDSPRPRMVGRGGGHGGGSAHHGYWLWPLHPLVHWQWSSNGRAPGSR